MDKSPTDACAEPPKWLSDLENRRKRPHKLAHEIGAGSPCFVCKEKCNGLNLHFWRKICIECKCRKEDHDFTDDGEYSQFEILFGAKKVKKTTLKFHAHNKTFDWVPQDASHELVVDYLNALPVPKCPVTNSEGAAYRKQQLERQLPLHDVNPSACHNLSTNEVTELGKYIEHLQRNVIGQGKIMKFRHCGFMADSAQVNHDRANSCCIQGVLVTDSKPETRIVSSEKVNSEPCSLSNSLKLDRLNHNQRCIGGSTTSHPEANVDILTKQHCDVNRFGKNVDGVRLDGSYGTVPTCDCHNNNSNTCTSCGNFRTDPGENCEELSARLDSVLNSNNVNNKLVSSPCSHVMMADSRKEPLNLNIMQVSSDQLPFTPLQESNSICGKRDGIKQTETPVKHHDLASTTPVGSESRKSHHVPNQTCAQCEESFAQDDVVVRTERGGNCKIWHARCFVCETCQELLVDLMYFFHDGKVYCGRDYARATNIPRCFACDELIFVKEYTQAEGQSYHVKHFCCYHCDVPLAGKQYIPHDDQPVCLDCYQTHYGKKCSACHQYIPVTDQRVSLGDLHFHLSPKCFMCGTCSKFLAGERFVCRNGTLFCSKECVNRFQPIS